MGATDDRIVQAARQTVILRPPKQKLATFGSTNLYYYLLTQPVYADPDKEPKETVIREGRVVTERPRIVTPYYLSRLDGFSGDARRYFDLLARTHGRDSPGLLYAYKNEPKELNIVSDDWKTVAGRLNEEIEQRGDNLATIIKGEDALWDVSLLKFIYEVTRGSVGTNVEQLGARGLLNVDSSGMPLDARIRIEEMFQVVAAGELEPHDLKGELDRWDVFDQYQDRFLALFRKSR